MLQPPCSEPSRYVDEGSLWLALLHGSFRAPELLASWIFGAGSKYPDPCTWSAPIFMLLWFLILAVASWDEEAPWDIPPTLNSNAVQADGPCLVPHLPHGRITAVPLCSRQARA